MIQELLQAKVNALATNGDSFSFLHAETDWQNLQADEITLPAVFLDMPIAFTPEITITGHFKRRYICVALFLYPSNLDDTPDQRYEAFKKAENVQRDFQLMINNDNENFEGLNVGRCYQIVNFMDRNMDGVVMPFDVVERNHDGVCVPATTNSNVTLKLNDAEWLEILCGTLQNITLQDADGFELTPFSVEGSTITIGNSIVTNSVGTVLATILSQENAELADVVHTDSDGTPTPTPSQVPFVCTPVAPCADGTVNVNKSDGALISAVSVASGGTEPYNVADSTAVVKDSAGTILSTTAIKATESEDIAVGDNTITLNGGAFLTLKAEEDEDIELVDTDNNPITPDSVVGAKITVDIPSIPVGAELMKTGINPTPFQTGDDADVNAGRGIDFLTLSDNNKFGNPIRFTDTLGGSTYANGIVLDHSQDNGSSIMGYDYNTPTTARSLPNHNAYYAGVTIDGFSGWRMPNLDEILCLGAKRQLSQMNYAPWNYTAGNLWSNTYVTSAAAQVYDPTGRSMGSNTHTNPFNAIGCRRFTYAELGL